MFLVKLLCFTFLILSSEAGVNNFLGILFPPNIFTTTPTPVPPQDKPLNVDQSCVCGRLGTVRSDDEKIINGQVVSPDYKYAWMGVLKSRGFPICSVFLINSKYVVTAAHCVKENDPKILQVLLGIHDKTQVIPLEPNQITGEPFGIEISVSKIKIHESYDPQIIQSNYDIALLKLSKPVKFTNQIKPICLPKQASEHNLPRMNAITAGWGYTESGAESNVLREVVLEAFGAKECQAFHGKYIFNENVCAGNPNKRSCFGDSGGPLFYKNKGSYTVIGVTSWGYECPTSELPTVFIRASAYTNWIYTNTKGAKYCENPDNGF